MTGLKPIWIGGLLLAQITPGFQFSLVARPVVELTLPADGSATFMPHPHFRWAEIAQADRYEIQIAGDAGFQTLADSDSIPVPRYVPLDELPSGHDYWWRVRVKLRSGRTGDWSPARKLIVSQPTHLYTVTTNDSVSVITNTIALAASNTPARLVFEPGTYRLALPNDTYLFKLQSVTNLIIDGSGSLVVMDNNNSGFSRFTGCTDILLRNFEVDYMTTNGIPTTHTAGSIISTQTNDASMVFQPLDGYLPPDDPRIRDATGRRWGCLMDTNTPGRLKVGVNNWFDFKTNVTSLGSGQYRLYLTDSHAGRLNDFKAGDTLVKSAAWYDSVMYATVSTNITYEQITSYAGSGNHFIGHWNDGVHFLRCASRIKAGRLVSNPCGAYIGAGYLTGMWIEECLTEGMFDDAGGGGNVPCDLLEKTADNQIRIWGVPARYIELGDTVSIYTPTAGFFNGTFTVTGIGIAPGGTLLTLDRAIGAVDPGIETTNTLVYVDKLACVYAYTRNSTFRNSRRMGCFFRFHSGVIEGNTFAGLSEVAILGQNETGSFDGGFDNRNVRILNNTITDCGYSFPFYSQDGAAIELSIAAYGTNCTQTVHRNIEIIGNTIYDWDGKGIAVKNAQDVLILSNTVVNLNATNFYPGGSNYGIYLDYTDGAYVIGNDLRDDREMTAPIFVTNSVNTVLDGNLLP
jgi:hypothetical protein